mmetsp:Transcript_22693/g.32021  ORF Transcript_22693/g.32021 Transcript_22693/m.32021 type:complete len:91 (-) Transcript_22693:145-417(-)
MFYLILPTLFKMTMFHVSIAYLIYFCSNIFLNAIWNEIQIFCNKHSKKKYFFFRQTFKQPKNLILFVGNLRIRHLVMNNSNLHTNIHLFY